MLEIVAVVAFLVVTAVIISGYNIVTAESPAAQRLKQLVPESVGTPRMARGAAAKKPGILKQMLAAVGQYGMGDENASLTHSLAVAGIRTRNAAALFIGTRTLLSFGPALAVLVSRVSSGKPMSRSLLLAGIVWAYGHVLVNYWLKRRAKRRIRRVEIALPDSLDLMVVCLEAGLGLNATIARVGEERSSMDDPLGQEFNQVSLELREGRSRDESLRALGDRNGVDDLKSLATLVIQSDKLGASMAKTLRAHADVLRTKRRQRAEEAARKLPIKILFPMAGFILPALFVIATGPSLLRIKDLIRTINGG